MGTAESEPAKNLQNMLQRFAAVFGRAPGWHPASGKGAPVQVVLRQDEVEVANDAGLHEEEDALLVLLVFGRCSSEQHWFVVSSLVFF